MAETKHIIGVVPAGGEARRISSFFKEMLPVAVDEDRKSKFIITSERIISDMLAAGAEKIHFILHRKKKFIVEYYENQNLFPREKVECSLLPARLESHGMPYTIDFVHASLREYDYVLLGLPDTVLEPRASFRAVLRLLYSHSADLALGLYAASLDNKGGYIEFNPSTKKVVDHIDHSSRSFPMRANNAWAVACWNKRFSQFMHNALKDGTDLRRLASKRGWTEIVFGDVIDLALQSPNLRVVADYVDRRDGFFWDISDPEKYFNLLRSYNIENGRFARQRLLRASMQSSHNPFGRRIFIGHGKSSSWEKLRDLLEDTLHLEWDEFNRVSTAGLTTQERLTEMIDQASMAFLVLTGDDEDVDGRRHARDNVIHEVGLFQAVLGPRRAIVLIEEGCEEFSNIVGLTQIRFPKGNILARTKEIVEVLEREGIISIGGLR